MSLSINKTTLISLILIGLTLISHDVLASRSVKMNGIYSGKGILLKIYAYSRSSRGTIGGNRGPKDITIHTRGTEISIKAKKGYQLGSESEITYISSTINFNGINPDEKGFYTESKPYENYDLDLTIRHYKVRFQVEYVLKNKSGKVQTIKLDLIARASAYNRSKLLIMDYNKKYFKLKSYGDENSKAFQKTIEHMGNAISVLDLKYNKYHLKKFKWAMVHLSNAAKIAGKYDQSLFRYLKKQIRKLKIVDQNKDHELARNIRDEIEYIIIGS